jgi:hypothetical protein
MFRFGHFWGLVLSFPLSVIKVTGAFWLGLGACDFVLASHGDETLQMSRN